jgi:hypothetical protein
VILNVELNANRQKTYLTIRTDAEKDHPAICEYISGLFGLFHSQGFDLRIMELILAVALFAHDVIEMISIITAIIPCGTAPERNLPGSPGGGWKFKDSVHSSLADGLVFRSEQIEQFLRGNAPSLPQKDLKNMSPLRCELQLFIRQELPEFSFRHKTTPGRLRSLSAQTSQHTI